MCSPTADGRLAPSPSISAFSPQWHLQQKGQRSAESDSGIESPAPLSPPFASLSPWPSALLSPPCAPPSRYFVSNDALVKHTATKLHKRRARVLLQDRPHSRLDAELAGGMGPPDNGPKLRAAAAAVAMAM
uniref:Uncharacterized protein n=1 Tax=Tetraselmis sp. GSL018 TaxID=582737 RepID=A0A061R7E4_9CHLO|eukprot:CAMPEP_0177599682 /NCGR_PEP_ID=MMETSP0419_2-20121207/13135_1 /TAXON_ID=582737 /ORGANISM="Tetraselmis sp., Strain GSL018" /LENGTH=130 /DNA_ID=CAMNT_0019092455 /DNA_START=73 /DNA_END=465 /DNA_ORIENTATION=+